MYNIDDVLQKLSTNSDIPDDFTLADIMPMSLRAFSRLSGSTLTREESRFLHQQAKEELKKNKIAEKRILTRANPQLQNAVHLGISRSSQQRSYNALFAERASRYARPGSVESMFSPAGYLTELYREAKHLHSESSSRNLDARRPDLKTLQLSQKNMDDELSTLQLSNELLLNGITSRNDTTYDKLMEELSTYRLTSATPFHLPYEMTRRAILLQDEDLSAFAKNPVVGEKVSPVLMMGVRADIPPELCNILTEDITPENEKTLFEKNFGVDAKIEDFSFIVIADYYNLTEEELSQYIDALSAFDNGDYTFILKLNKNIRLCQASGLSPATLQAIVRSDNEDFVVNASVLGRIFYADYYKTRYGLIIDDALVLCGSAISQTGTNDRPDYFTRLFNTPPLNGRVFYADDEPLDLQPGKSEDSFRLGVLKRAFQVNDTELYTLWLLANGGKYIPFTCSLTSLSLVCRVWLQAKINGLTVNELSQLWSVSPYAGQGMAGLSGEKLHRLITALTEYTQWLDEQRWQVRDAFLMTTDQYSTTLTSEIKNLTDTLRNGLAGQAFTADGAIPAAAPFIAAAVQLDSTIKAEIILRWVEQIKPEGLLVADFLVLAAKELLTDEETRKLVVFCQVMGQLVLIVRSVGLTVSELSLVVLQPERFDEHLTALPHGLSTLQDLTRFHAFITRCGSHATEVQTELGEGTLTAELLAEALSLDSVFVTQAIQQACPGAGSPGTWKQVDAIQQWMDVASTLGITPSGVGALIALDYNSKANIYGAWQAAADDLQSGLDEHQTARLQGELDECISTALAAYYIRKVALLDVRTRDDLFSYLLIDNQVAAQVTTTRLAEAIASVQLYVSQALNSIESDAVADVKTRQFFTDWDRYNNRYSTWAGVSKLVYYPENYVDPTMRVGQTAMMDTLLQQTSQSQLTTDKIEEGFLNYLTVFEEVANLNAVSGYHDNIDADEGSTYFIGQSRSEPKKYYWRQLDCSKHDAGRYPSNAWSEWHEITSAIAPYKQFIRPVTCNSRLYIAWVEQEVRKNDDGETSTTHYYLKLSYHRYDDSWAAPYTFDVTESFTTLLSGGTGEPDDVVGLFCAEVRKSNTLVFIFYKLKDAYSPGDIDSSTDDYAGFEFSLIQNSLVTLHDDTLKTYIALSCNVMDTLTQQKVNFIMMPFEVTTKIEYEYHDSFEMELSDINVHVSLTQNAGVKIEIPTSTLTLKIPVETFGYDRGFEDRVYKGVCLNYANQNVEVYARQIEFTAGYFYPPFLTIGLNDWTEPTSELFVLMTGYFVLPEEDKYNILSAFTYPEKEPYNTVLSSSQCIGNDELTMQERYYKSLAFGNDVIDGAIGLEIYSKGFGEETATLKFDGSKSKRIPLLLNENINAECVFLDGTRKKIEESGFTGPALSSTKKEFSTLAFETAGEETFKVVYTVTSGDITGTATCTVTIAGLAEGISRPIILETEDNGAQYIQSGAYRTRLNTLFANQLIARANAGIDNVLALDTQNIQEPKLGDGNYVKVDFGVYDAALHGDGTYELYVVGAVSDSASGSRSKDLCASGVISGDRGNTVLVFIPYNSDKEGADKGKIFISVDYSDLSLSDNYKNMQEFKFDTTSKSFVASADNPTRTRGLQSTIMNTQTEPMDFSGANALYFWELFYYTPMMVFQRLLQEQNFTEATRWLQYIWNPAGCTVDGNLENYYWNVRPLLEDTSWNASPLDSVDPDAVAQNDPMHYKLATFMKALDLLIARGDAAYRQLERDTLSEAKMWYLQALSLLGREPYAPPYDDWADPSLGTAADDTAQRSHRLALLQLRRGVSLELLTANSLTDLFLPELNDRLQGHWKTLEQRLYNLRHNLSIDGQPLLLPVYAAPAAPSALLRSAVASSQGDSALPDAGMPVHRFPVMHASAQAMVAQLTQFGSTLLSLSERQDAEGLSELLQTQGCELARQSIGIQEKTIAEIDADKAALLESRRSAQARFDSYASLYDENVNSGEARAMNLSVSASTVDVTASALHMSAAGLKMVPNIYGLATGGAEYGALFNATAIGSELASGSMRIRADVIGQSEMYRRRRQEWEMQRDSAESDVRQLDAQLDALDARSRAAVMQKTYLETQQAQTQVQLDYLLNRFSSRALYNWLRGQLSAIYYQFYDLTVSRCLMAEKACRFELADKSLSFIRPGAWRSTYAGLLAGETLMLNLAQMEKTHMDKECRVLEVTRTVSLAQVYNGLPDNNSFVFTDAVTELLGAGAVSKGPEGNNLVMESGELRATLTLHDLSIETDYPADLGAVRRIKQISVTLPSLVGPYQDVRAVLSYSGSVVMPRGCTAIAVSHGMNDSGLFMLDFNDPTYLPFEGVPVGDSGSLTLSFPDADGRQKTLLLSLSDIILHIRYTILN